MEFPCVLRVIIWRYSAKKSKEKSCLVFNIENPGMAIAVPGHFISLHIYLYTV